MSECYRSKRYLLTSFLLLLLGRCTDCSEPKYSMVELTHIEINPKEFGKTHSELYLGPPSIDVSEDGSIYVLNGGDNSIEKFSHICEKVWKIENISTLLDIKVYGSSLFSFDGKNVCEYNLESGIPVDTFAIPLGDEEFSPVGNVSQFYGRYLFINKDSFREGEEQLFVFDLDQKKVSPRIPVGHKFPPITNCQACKASFVKEIFEQNVKFFINQSEKEIVYLDSDSIMNIKPEINIFNKRNGQVRTLKNIPFFKELCLTTIRFIILNSRDELIFCTLVQEKYVPKRLVFYKLTMLK